MVHKLICSVLWFSRNVLLWQGKVLIKDPPSSKRMFSLSVSPPCRWQALIYFEHRFIIVIRFSILPCPPSVHYLLFIARFKSVPCYAIHPFEFTATIVYHTCYSEWSSWTSVSSRLRMVWGDPWPLREYLWILGGRVSSNKGDKAYDSQ